MLGLMAALFATSAVVVSYQGLTAPTYAIAAVGVMVVMLMSLLVSLQPIVPLVVVLIFVTSPVTLVLSPQWSAFISAALLGGAFLGFTVRTSWRTISSDPLFLPVVVFALYGLVSATYGLLAGNQIGYVLGDSFQIIEFASVYFLVTQLINDSVKVNLVLKLLLGSMLFTVLAELTLFTLGPGAGDLLPSWDGSFISGSLVRTIDIDATILFAVLINLYPAAVSRRQRRWIGVALIPTIANIALSLSRGLWLCVLAAAIFSGVLLVRTGRRRFLASLAIASLCLVMLAAIWNISSGSRSDTGVSLLNVLEERVFYGADQVALGLAGNESMATRRFLEMAIVGPQVLAKPWIGHGLGATYVIGGFAVLDSGTNQLIDHHFIHNLYLVTAFRMGVVGLGLLLWVLGSYFRTALAAFRRMPAGTSKGLVAGFIAVIVGQLFLSLIQPTIIDHPTGALIACAMALTLKIPGFDAANLSQLAKNI